MCNTANPAGHPPTGAAAARLNAAGQAPGRLSGLRAHGKGRVRLTQGGGLDVG